MYKGKISGPSNEPCGRGLPKSPLIFNPQNYFVVVNQQGIFNPLFLYPIHNLSLNNISINLTESKSTIWKRTIQLDSNKLLRKCVRYYDILEI